MAKRKRIQTADYGAQQLLPNDGTYRLEGALRRADGALVVEELRSQNEGKAKRARVLTQCQLDRYFAQNPQLLSWRQHEAGSIARTIWSRAGFETIRGVNLQGVSGGSRSESARITDSMVDARRQYQELERAIGQRLARVIYMVAILDHSAKDFGLANGLGKNDGIGILRYALDAAADHFNLPDRQ